MIRIELKEEEAEMFKLMRKYRRQFKTLVRNGVFDWSNGSVTIHKDPDGNIDRVTAERVMFKYGKGEIRT